MVRQRFLKILTLKNLTNVIGANYCPDTKCLIMLIVRHLLTKICLHKEVGVLVGYR